MMLAYALLLVSCNVCWISNLTITTHCAGCKCPPPLCLLYMLCGVVGVCCVACLLGFLCPFYVECRSVSDSMMNQNVLHTYTLCWKP